MGPKEFTKFDILAWWKGRESQFTGIIDTKNKTHTGIFGDVYLLEDHLEAAKRIQHISSLEDGLDYEEQLHDVEVETDIAFSLSDEEIALDEAASEARSSEADNRSYSRRSSQLSFNKS
ncbi:hypothetical protein Tco_1413621 [Tanacetum coccineum]